MHTTHFHATPEALDEVMETLQQGDLPDAFKSLGGYWSCDSSNNDFVMSKDGVVVLWTRYPHRPHQYTRIILEALADKETP